MGQLVWQNCSFSFGDGVLLVGLYFGTLIPLFLLTTIWPALCEHDRPFYELWELLLLLTMSINSSTQPVKPVVLPRCESGYVRVTDINLL
jgi:hypothetical protein